LAATALFEKLNARVEAAARITRWRTSRAEPERKIKLPGGGLAGAAEDPALLLYAGRKREPPDRPPPGVPQEFFHAAGRMELRPRQAPANAGLREVYIMPALN
jgi:hypothetical protein